MIRQLLQELHDLGLLCLQKRLYEVKGLWRQSDSVPERFFERENLKNSQQTTTKA